MQVSDSTKQEILALEKRYRDAIRQNDPNVTAMLSDDPCVVVGAHGVGELHRAAMAEMMKKANWKLEQYKLDDVHVRAINDDVVAVAYKVDEDLIVDGEKIHLEAFDSSVWKRENGSWVCVLHTESPKGDPFGRH